MPKSLPVACILICVGLGLLGFISSCIPILSDAEEDLGLHLLYKLRGAASKPSNVAVVAIDRESAKILNLPAASNKWPRTLHARLLKQLSAQQAAVVVFDLIFHENQGDYNDQTLAVAMQNAGNVILTQTIDRQTMPLSDSAGHQMTHLNIEIMLSAIPVLSEAAIGQAPFPLPKIPIKLNQFWCFRPASDDTPTLPVAALHVYAAPVFDNFIELARKVNPSIVSNFFGMDDSHFDVRKIIKSIRPLHALFNQNPSFAQQMEVALGQYSQKIAANENIQKIRSLIQLYQHGNSRYLNLYGPPGTIETISYHRLIAASHSPQKDAQLPSLKGKVVFVGQTENAWFKANDGFYTAFTDASGTDISGVEIAATAFANLLEDKAVYPLKRWVDFGLFLVWGMLVAIIAMRFSATMSAMGVLLVISLYIGLAHIQFKSRGIWFPLVIPILIQAPMAFIAGTVWKYRQANIERRNIRSAFGHYLPDAVVDRLSGNIKEIRAGGQVLYSICLFTDAQNYTPLSETMDPESLADLMNDYYAAVFGPIKANGGLVSQVTGDSVLALWTAPEPLNELKQAACRAAVEIAAVVNQFNAQANPYLLPTRIGIHAGQILLGNIGTTDHFEYRPVGDIVNTASRLEGLNKYLGTQTLVSKEAYAPESGVTSRYMGRFVFKGKSHPVQVYELMQQKALSQELQMAVCRIFATGLEAFGHQCWKDAQHYFSQVLQIYKNDGASRFYYELSLEYQRHPPSTDWDGVVYLQQK